MSLTLDDLLKPNRIVREVRLKDRGGSVYVRALTAGEALAYHERIKAAGEDSRTLTAHQIAAYLGTADGSSMVTLDQAVVLVDALSQRDAAAILRAGTELNRLDDDAIEAAAKN